MRHAKLLAMQAVLHDELNSKKFSQKACLLQRAFRRNAVGAFGLEAKEPVRLPGHIDRENAPAIVVVVECSGGGSAPLEGVANLHLQLSGGVSGEPWMSA